MQLLLGAGASRAFRSAMSISFDMAQKERMKTAFVVAVWFVLNISIGILTKWVFLYGEVCINGDGCQRYNFPLMMTVIHLLVSQAICYVYIHWVRVTQVGHQLHGMERFRKICPLAICFALSVGMGNMSLNYIYPSFKQMVGAGSPIVTVAMAVTFTKVRYNSWTWATMPLICGGLWLCGKDEAHFSAVGLAYSVGAMILRSAKSIVQGQLLSKDERIEPVNLLYYMAPYAAGLVLIMSLLFEGTKPLVLILEGYQHSGLAGVGSLLFFLFVSGLNACLLNITGFLVTRYTSAVTLQVLGSLKSCIGILVSVAVLKNPLTAVQTVGVFICIFGVWVYDKKGGTVSGKKLDRTVSGASPKTS